MKKFMAALIFSFFLSNICFSQTIISRQSKSNRDLLLKLLDFPSPPENRYEQISEWLKREDEKLSDKTNVIPADDASVEEIIKFWAGKRIYDVPKPTEQTQEILLEAVKKDSSLVSSLLSFLPTHKQGIEIVTNAFSELKNLEKESSFTSSKNDIEKWLMFNGNYKRIELIAAVEEIQKELDREDKYGSVINDEQLKALAKLDWDTAYPFINSYWWSNKPRLSTLALTLLYEHAVKENSPDAENFREQLKPIVTDKSAKGFARNAALKSLMQTEWQGRDEWFISLFSDETISNFSDINYGYEPLSYIVEENPDYWVPKIIKLLGNPNRTIHKAAERSLASFDKYRAREDAMRALLPYADDEDSSLPVYSLNFIYLPESIPVLKKIVQKEEGFVRGYAAEALGVKYKIADAAPILEKALMSEPDTTYQNGIIQGLVHCGGLSDEKKIKAIEFYLQNQPQEEIVFSEERNPLIGLGIYLSRFESTNEQFTKTLFDYANEIQKDSPEISARIKSLIYSWNNREANLLLIKAIEEEKTAADDILTVIQKREEIKKDFYGEIQFWIEKGDKKAGIAAVILEDEEKISEIINGNDFEAQSFLFASARLTEKFTGGNFLIQGTGIKVQVKLPLEKVNQLFAKKDKDLSAAIEKYLEADDGEIARKLILSQHEGEAKIVGRRLPKQFGGGFEDLDKWEESFRREILKDKNLEEIYATRTTVIRIHKGKAEVTTVTYDWETGKPSERKYFLSEDKLLKLRTGFAKTNPFTLKPLSIPSNSCWLQPSSSEFLYLTKNGGVRIYMAGSFREAGTEEYENLLNFWDSL